METCKKAGTDNCRLHSKTLTNARIYNPENAQYSPCERAQTKENRQTGREKDRQRPVQNGFGSYRTKLSGTIDVIAGPPARLARASQFF